MKKFLNQKREIAYKFIDGESHYVLGKKYLLKIIKSADSFCFDTEDCPLLYQNTL